MYEWDPERVDERAKQLREASKEMHEKGDFYLKQAILLEEISKAWAASRESELPRAHWIRWGMYLKCSRCGHLSEEQADTCPECKAEMERK